MDFIEIIKSVIYGIVEGITEWLPISSTGHLILFNEFMPMKVSEDFWNMFLVVIQLGAILAVVVNFWVKIWPFNTKVKNKPFIRYDVMNMWVKIIVACLPAAVIGLLFDEFFRQRDFCHETGDVIGSEELSRMLVAEIAVHEEPAEVVVESPVVIDHGGEQREYLGEDVRKRVLIFFRIALHDLQVPFLAFLPLR